jgi:ActR/RegA family two-component response regulator
MGIRKCLLLVTGSYLHMNAVVSSIYTHCTGSMRIMLNGALLWSQVLAPNRTCFWFVVPLTSESLTPMCVRTQSTLSQASDAAALITFVPITMSPPSPGQSSAYTSAIAAAAAAGAGVSLYLPRPTNKPDPLPALTAARHHVPQSAQVHPMSVIVEPYPGYKYTVDGEASVADLPASTPSGGTAAAAAAAAAAADTVAAYLPDIMRGRTRSEVILTDSARLGQLTPKRLGLHLLFVDDDVVNRNLGKRMLVRLGCTVVMLDDGIHVETALLSAEIPYDALLLDIQMPRLNGDTVCRMLRARGETIPIIAMTGTARAHCGCLV